MPRKNKQKKEKNPLNFHVNPNTNTTLIDVEDLKKEKKNKK